MATYEIKTDTSIHAAIVKAVETQLGKVPVEVIGDDSNLKVTVGGIELSSYQETNLEAAFAQIYEARGLPVPTVTKSSDDKEVKSIGIY